MKKILLLPGLFICLIFNHISAQTSINAFYIGHSLSDQIPDMVKSLSDDAALSFNWAYQWIPGAPLRWQWQRKDALDYDPIPPHYRAFYDAQFGLAGGNFEVLVLTESVPRYHAIIDETYQYADSFYVYAKRFNPGIKIYLYEDWHCLDSGTPAGCDYDVNASSWRKRLSDDLPMWEGVVNYLNTKFKPSDPVCLIPSGQALARLYDSIQVGALPGIAKIEDIFADRIHLNDIGKYFVACTHFAAIHQKSPEGLTRQTQVWWGGDFTPPSPALATKMQSIAWQAVKDYPMNCLGTTVDTKEIGPNYPPTAAPWPNPVESILNIDKMTNYRLYCSFGQMISAGFGNTIDLSIVPAGIYFVHLEGGIFKIVKH